MANKKKKVSFWRRLRDKYRISILNEVTLTEQWHLHLNGWGAIVAVGMLFLLALGLFSLVIIYTPIKHYLPGYSVDVSQELIQASARVDSMGTQLELQRQYLNTIKRVVSGDIEIDIDSVQSIDSLQIILREQLLEAKNEITEEFLVEYEKKEKDNITMFNNSASSYTPLYTPVKGTIVQSFSEKDKQYSVTIQTQKKANVTSVLDGRVIYVNHEMNNVYSIIIKHATYISVYQGLGQLTKQVGDVVRKAENIGVMHGDVLKFELWEDMRAVDPASLIAF